MMQPEESLATIERTIRKAIRLMLPGWRRMISDSDTGRATNALANESRSRQGVEASGDLLDYLYTRPAFALIRDNWAEFEPMLGDRARIEALLAVVEDVRNTVAHGRELVSYERDLVSGIAGYLTNLVALWETRAADLAAHYPVISTVRDSFGREGSDSEYVAENKVRVDVGQVVDFTAQATEARGQGILWVVRAYDAKFALANEMQMMSGGWQPRWTARGPRVRFRFTFSERHVGEEMRVWVAITSKSKHHRHPSMDDFRLFYFAVNPPHDA